MLLEALVTTLLSLEYWHPNSKPAPLHYEQRSSSSLNIPSRCPSRSNSLTSLYSTISNESESVLALSSSTTTTSREFMSASTPPSDGNTNTSNTNGKSSKQYQYHCPPNSTPTTQLTTYYQDNDTVFGSILRGELPTVTLMESDRLVALEDIAPRAPLHALIIPKAFVGSIFDVTVNLGSGSASTSSTTDDDDQGDLEWMTEAQDMALTLIQEHHPKALAQGDYRLVFHVPPFNSVPHLHLHVLAPLSEMSWFYRYIKYHPNTRWCIPLTEVMDRLVAGKSSVPFRRPPISVPQRQRMPSSASSSASASLVVVVDDNNTEVKMESNPID